MRAAALRGTDGQGRPSQNESQALSGGPLLGPVAKEHYRRMAKITFIQPDGSKTEVDATPGTTVMEAAKLNLVPGVEAECGGACACATCHVYVDEAWRERTGTPSQMEEDMLDFAFDVREESRLSCQIKVTPDLDGLVVRVPEKQF
jgi:ferredoxin, 2Fe-2S